MKCQRDIEGNSKCPEQCDHCKTYYVFMYLNPERQKRIFEELTMSLKEYEVGLGEKNIAFRTGSVNDNYGRYARAITVLQ